MIENLFHLNTFYFIIFQTNLIIIITSIMLKYSAVGLFTEYYQTIKMYFGLKIDFNVHTLYFINNKQCRHFSHVEVNVSIFCRDKFICWLNNNYKSMNVFSKFDRIYSTRFECYINFILISRQFRFLIIFLYFP